MWMQEIYEKLGLFYLGKDVDKESLSATEALTLLKNKNFTTHAAIIGMTGSGKTGLGVGIIEEAAIDNIPAIVIDPKGDMGDLCLTDPTFRPETFEPWVKDEAEAKGEESHSYAKKIAQMWKEGIESWGQTPERVSRFAAVKKSIYTPGSSAGLPINIMASLDTPPAEIMEESDTFASYLKSTAVSLLSLIGEDTGALDSPEYILIAQILTKAWLSGESMGIDRIIGQIINPPFKKIGVLPLDAFFPQEKRFKLATKFNALLASPSFSMWLQGENLDIQKLLYDENGKAKISIFSISHLNDEERMFFVTLLLNKYIAWMRRQSGTSRLKTLLYMDEIFGFFPPTQNPPSKEPMLLLLKQARAFGVGVVLSTQNPVDLDYKGLSNIGTWFIGRLQTTQDIERVIDGLGGQIGSSFDKSEIRNLLANLQKRTFFLKSAHLDDIRLFSTRWVLSYLKGPLKKKEIAVLMEKQKQHILSDTIRPVSPRTEQIGSEQTYQQIDASISQYFEPNPSAKKHFYATLGAKVSVHFFSQRRGIDEEREIILSLPVDETLQRIDWSSAAEEEEDFEKFPNIAPKEAYFSTLPDIILEDKGLRKSIKELKEYLYQTETITLWKCERPKLESRVGESKADFMIRLEDLLQEKKEEEIDKLKERYAKKEKTLLDRLSRAQERVEKEEADSTSTFIETGIAVLGALFGRTSAAKIGRAVNKGGKILKERGEMSRAQERVQKIQDDIQALSDELEDKIDQLFEKYDIERYEISEVKVKPRRTDIDVHSCALVWRI
jgi:Skp family chaperone for outer membrane proteins